jgi:hypothetical protein
MTELPACAYEPPPLCTSGIGCFGRRHPDEYGFEVLTFREPRFVPIGMANQPPMMLNFVVR